MSHVVSIQSKIHDVVAVAAACHRLNLTAPVQGKATLFSAEVSGLLVSLPGWNYPAVIDTTSGEIRFDNYAGAWGEIVHLDRFLQMYSVEKTKIEARKKGYQTTEHALEDGSIRVQMVTA